MAFNYQTLKNLTNESIVPLNITTDSLAANAVKTAKITNTTVTATQLGTSAVDLASSVVTGTLPTNKGGTGLSSLGSAYRALVVNSANNAFEYKPTGISRMVVFTSNGTWTKPSTDIRYIYVQVQGAGGGAGGHGESGAAGGYAEKVIDVTGISSVAVTIGAGGGGTYYNNAGGNATASSFGSYVSASGGHGCNRHNNHNGGLPGVGSGGDVNLYGGAGGGHEQRSSGMGGSTFWGGPAPAGHPQGGHFSHNHQGHAAPGTGGTSGHFSGHRGSDGKNGIIVITEFY